MDESCNINFALLDKRNLKCQARLVKVKKLLWMTWKWRLDQKRGHAFMSDKVSFKIYMLIYSYSFFILICNVVPYFCCCIGSHHKTDVVSSQEMSLKIIHCLL